MASMINPSVNMPLKAWVRFQPPQQTWIISMKHQYIFHGKSCYFYWDVRTFSICVCGNKSTGQTRTMFSQNTCWPTVPTFIMATGRSMLLNWCPILLHLHLFLFRPTRGNIRAVRVTSSPHICPSLPPSVSLHSITSIHLSYNPPISNSGVLSSSCVPTFVCLSTCKTPAGSILCPCVCILVCIYVCVLYVCDVTNISL